MLERMALRSTNRNASWQIVLGACGSKEIVGRWTKREILISKFEMLGMLYRSQSHRSGYSSDFVLQKKLGTCADSDDSYLSDVTTITIGESWKINFHSIPFGSDVEFEKKLDIAIDSFRGAITVITGHER
jgi:hypothetical protein